MIERVYDPERVNSIVNDPSVFPFVSLPGQEALDVSAAIDDRRNVVLMCASGGFFFEWKGRGEYEAHSFFLPSARGRTAIAAGKAALAYMFDAKADKITAQCPDGNRPVLGLTRILGFRFSHVAEAAWLTSAGYVDAKVFEMTRSRWAELTGERQCRLPQ